MDIITKLTKKQVRIILGIGMVLIIGIMVSVYKVHFKPIQITGSDETRQNMPKESLEKPEKRVEQKKVIVHISGAIKKPGVYKLDSGTRIFDVIQMADGFEPGADLKKINLASLILDGQRINIPLTSTPRPHQVQTRQNKSTKKTISINSASINELTTVSGIGAKTAKLIIDFRKKNGAFSQIKDLQKVKGIGPKKLVRIKKYLSL